jgi:hypothetical protein
MRHISGPTTLLALTIVLVVALPQPAHSQGALVIDHTCTDLSQIPPYWIDQARQLAIHYAHTSHGGQLMQGISYLEGQDPTLSSSIFYAGASAPTSTSCAPDTICVFDGNPPETYIEPDDYWASPTGIQRTEAVADSGLFGFSMWSWCGQQSSNSVETVNEYLARIDAWDSSYAGMRFILMTGHTDGGSEILARNNNMVRQYALDHGMVLYDFADIESWDPDGTYYADTSDGCAWCDDWCLAHPTDCVDLPSCNHSHGFNCALKGRAFWWMMARLAGWPGPEGVFVDDFECGSCSGWSTSVGEELTN